MPAIVGIVQVNNVGSSGVVHIGDVYRIAPRASTKTFSGAGSFNTGEKLYIYNHRSQTNTNDPDVSDQGMAFNA
jgi:spore germination protein PA